MITPGRRIKMWRYHVYDQNNKQVKVSDYDYSTEKAALEAAAEYVKGRVPRDSVWHTVASHQ
jgi:hypothetical protein